MFSSHGYRLIDMWGMTICNNRNKKDKAWLNCVFKATAIEFYGVKTKL